jgi:hypothetical protein
LQEGRERAVHLLQLGLGACEQFLEVVVSGGDAVDDVLEDELEFVEELLGFFGEAEDAVVDGGEVELVEDRGEVFFLLFFLLGGRAGFGGFGEGVEVGSGAVVGFVLGMAGVNIYPYVYVEQLSRMGAPFPVAPE